MNGGYDDGYTACPCFWGKKPGSLVELLGKYLPEYSGISVLDAGCGEGKNAAYFAERGATVTAIDVSEKAIANAVKAWPRSLSISFKTGSIESMDLSEREWGIVVMYGLLHCLPDKMTIKNTIIKLQNATRRNGYHLLVAFNDREQDLTAHPGFFPTLATHESYLEAYSAWDILHSTDTDLHEVHPHNNIPHTHSMTRILARKH